MSIPSWARPGVKVVCVDNKPPAKKVPGYQFGSTLDGLTSGQIYTIRDIVFGADGVLSVRLMEIIRKPNGGRYWNGQEGGYKLSRFRPLTEVSETDKTEQALFRKKGLRLTAPKPERTNA